MAENYSDYLIRRAVYELLFDLEHERLNHVDCSNRQHHIGFCDNGIQILHDDELDISNAEILMRTIEVHDSFFTDSQRATLINRLTNFLRSVL